MEAFQALRNKMSRMFIPSTFHEKGLFFSDILIIAVQGTLHMRLSTFTT